MSKVTLEGMLDMDLKTPKLMLDNRDLWNILDEYYSDGNCVKITIEEFE
jgi:hypothetical protein